VYFTETGQRTETLGTTVIVLRPSLKEQSQNSVKQGHGHLRCGGTVITESDGYWAILRRGIYSIDILHWA